MGNLLSLYFLHPITTRLANKTQRFNPRYKLTNPTKTPPSPFAFSLLSVILLHLHYTLQPPFTLFSIPFSLCYSPSFSCYPVSSSPVTTPPFLCYSVSSYPVSPLLIFCYYPRSHVTLSPSTLLLSLVPLLLCLLLPCHLILCLSCPPSLSCKECLPVLSTGAFTLSKTRPFKHAEHAFLAPWRRPSCM